MTDLQCPATILLVPPACDAAYVVRTWPAGADWPGRLDAAVAAVLAPPEREADARALAQRTGAPVRLTHETPAEVADLFRGELVAVLTPRADPAYRPGAPTWLLADADGLRRAPRGGSAEMP